jgi:hypothetical protein
MKWHALTKQDWMRAIGIGIGVSVLTAAFMAATLRAGISPLPKALGLAFAETVMRRPLPLPVGLLFRDALTIGRAMWLGLLLWIFVLVFFFPVVGWGFLGLAVSPKLIFGSALPHLLFSILLWGGCWWVFGRSSGLIVS